MKFHITSIYFFVIISSPYFELWQTDELETSIEISNREYRNFYTNYRDFYESHKYPLIEPNTHVLNNEKLAYFDYYLSDKYKKKKGSSCGPNPIFDDRQRSNGKSESDIPSFNYDPAHQKRLSEYNECFHKEREKQKRYATREERKTWNRSKCDDKRILQYIDFLFFLTNDYELYEDCLKSFNTTEKETWIELAKNQIFHLTKPISLNTNKFTFTDPEQVYYANEILKLTREILVHYSNFQIYYEYFPKSDFEDLGGFDYLFQPNFPLDLNERILKQVRKLSGIKYTLLFEQFSDRRIKKSKMKLIDMNLDLLNQSIENLKFLKTLSYFPKDSLIKIAKLESCLFKIPKPHLQYINLEYYTGFIFRYGKGYYTYDLNEFPDPEFKAAVDFYHNRLYNSELFILRLNEIFENCEKVRILPTGNLIYDSIFKKYPELLQERKL